MKAPSYSALFVTRVVVLSASAVGLIWVFYQSTFLRPIGDDYCFAASVSSTGIMPGFVSWTTNHSGYFTTLFSQILTVGWPLTFLPYTIASALPFVICAAMFGYLVTLLISKSVSSTGTNSFGRYWPVIPLAMLTWWIYWLSGQHLSYSSIYPSRNWWDIPGYNEVPLGAVNQLLMTHFQTISGAFIAIFALASFAVLAFTHSPGGAKRPLQLALVVVLGFLSGGTNLSFALTILLVLVGAYILGVSLARTALYSLYSVGLVLGLSVAILLNFNSEARDRLNTNNLELSKLMGGVVNGFEVWISFVLSPILLIIFAVGWATAACVSVVKRGDKAGQTLLWVAGFVAFISLIHSLIVGAIDQLYYRAPWHYYGVSILILLSLFIGGYALGLLTLRHLSQATGLLGVVSSVTLLMVGVASLLSWSISTRADQWASGTAPLTLSTSSGSEVTVLADIEQSENFGILGRTYTQCWNQLQLDRSRAQLSFGNLSR